MLKKFTFALVVFGIFAFTMQLSAQGLQGRQAFGLNFGGNQQYSESRYTPFGFGASGFYAYRLTDRFSLKLDGGYNQMGFKLGTPLVTRKTDLFYLDLLADYELMDINQFRPFVTGGVGGFNFKYAVPGQEARYNDAEFVAGGGLRYFLNPTMAISISGVAKYTTGDDLDGAQRGGNSINDVYYSLRSGFSYYWGSKTTTPLEDPLFSDNLDVENVGDNNLGEDNLLFTDNSTPTDDNELADFLNKLNSMDDVDAGGSSSSGSLAMDEYIRLKERIDALNTEIEVKEHEIYTLQASLSENSQNGFAAPSDRQIRIVDNNYDQSMVSMVSQFSQYYEGALNKFYNRRYQEAVDIFQILLTKYPEHSLASNCEYWIGESFFNTGNYDRASESFDRILQYENSLKKDDALYMNGRAYLELGQKSKANEFFNRLINEYPDSEFVDKTRNLIE